MLKRAVPIFLAAAIIGILGRFILIQGRSNSGGDDTILLVSDFASEEMPLPVKTVKVGRSELILKLKFPGEAIAARRMTLEAEVPGVIESLNVKEGQHVEKGEVLVHIRDKEYRLELQRAEAERLRILSEFVLEHRFSPKERKQPSPPGKEEPFPEENFPGIKEMLEKDAISDHEKGRGSRIREIALIESGEKKEEVMAAVKGLTQAEIGVERARMNLEKTTIKAPFSGVVCDIQVAAQENVTSRRALFTLVDMSRIKVLVKILESEIGRIRVDQNAEMWFSAYPGRMYRGRVETISPLVNPEERTCSAVLELLAPHQTIKPGMHADVEIVTEIYTDRLIVPHEAILVRGGRKMVFVVENGLAKWRYIQTGLENRNYVEILGGKGGGIREGESVIVDGHFTLAHDVRVRTVN